MNWKNGEQNHRVRFQAVENIKAGKNISIWGICPVGIAARDIEAGEEVHYDPDKNTVDVIVREDEDANSPQL